MYTFRLILILVLVPALVFGIFENPRCFNCRWILGPCISYSHVCDGDFDCPNGEDEENCPFVCPYPDFYKCADTGLCISAKQLCNGIPDCMNAEDEIPQYCPDYLMGRPYGYRPYLQRTARSYIKNENLTTTN